MRARTCVTKCNLNAVASAVLQTGDYYIEQYHYRNSKCQLISCCRNSDRLSVSVVMY
jgi:hypothetical protein